MNNINWLPIDSAPKSKDGECIGRWILGVDRFSEIKVIRWTNEYPSKGEWMFAYAPTDYMDDIQGFTPTHWVELPEPPANV